MHGKKHTKKFPPYVHTHTHTHIYIYTHTHIHLYIYIYGIYIYIYYIYTCIHIHIHTLIYIHQYTHAYICIQVHILIHGEIVGILDPCQGHREHRRERFSTWSHIEQELELGGLSSGMVSVWGGGGWGLGFLL